ncbi:MAG TPA: LuxR C-terminal-related transcriptional regulator [Solirubrobacteraceae bacterium]|nr:LuxR C-terminal-related transcriptional regulator [Solirubrobacteraceae bacterium]
MAREAVAAGARGKRSYAVSLLEDGAGVLAPVGELLAGRLRPAARPGSRLVEIGMLGWTSASREEIARIPALRAEHDGPLVAVLGELPAALGARTLAARLEGTILASELERTLEPTLAAVAAGQCVIPRAIRQVVDRPPLSPRERQILAMVVLDFSNAEIARKLFVSESNVKSHLSSAFQKLGVKSRSAATELILDRESGLGPGILRISAEESLPEL